MLSNSFLLSKVRAAYPNLNFTDGEAFQWSPHEKTIYYHPDGPAFDLIHELAHALLGHTSYTKDIQLLEMERDAWARAITIAAQYDITVTEDYIQDALDTYRDWLHARSTCPECNATGLQSKKSLYRCLVCSTEWRVNDARVCALRRYKLTKNTPQ